MKITNTLLILRKHSKILKHTMFLIVERGGSHNGPFSRQEEVQAKHELWLIDISALSMKQNVPDATPGDLARS